MNPRQHLPPQERLSDKDREYANTAADMIRKARTSLATAKDEIELRKWVVERACEIYPHWPHKTDPHDQVSSEGMLYSLMRGILNFVHEPLNDALDKIQRET